MKKRTRNLDAKDRQILSILHDNARTPVTAIAKQVGQSKQVVSYRVSQLISDGIITRFVTVVNPHRLGYFSYNVLIKLQYFSDEQERRCVEELKAMPEVGWVVTVVGAWNLVVGVLVENPKSFVLWLEQLYARFSRYIHATDHYVVTEAIPGTTGTVMEQQLTESHRFPAAWERPQVKDLDRKLLLALVKEPRISILELAQKTDCRPETARARIDVLQKQHVLLGWTAKIRPSALAQSWYLLLFELDFAERQEKERLVKWLTQEKHVFFIVEAVGSHNLIVDILVSGPDDLKEVLNAINREFGKIVKACEPLLVHEEHKCQYIPDTFMKLSE